MMQLCPPRVYAELELDYKSHQSHVTAPLPVFCLTLMKSSCILVPYAAFRGYGI